MKHKETYCVLGAKPERVCAYCRLHRCNMSAKQIKRKKCLSKECVHLKKIEAHPYWNLRKSMKQRAKLKQKAKTEQFLR